MKHTRLIACLLILIFLSNYTLFANAIEITQEDIGVIIHDQEKNETIDQLFLLRNELELNYELNKVQIDAIDQQLQSLGVETISHAEAASKLGIDALPTINFTSTDSTRWTSRRLVTTFRGQHYELQILEAVPISASSPLRVDYQNVCYEAEGITAGVTKVLTTVAVSALTAGSVIGEPLSTGITLLSLLGDSYETIMDSISTSTVIDRVTGSATISFTVHMKYILVKPYQAPDSGNQLRSYVGNSVSYLITTLSIIDVLENNQIVPYHDVSASVRDTAYCPYFDDYSIATLNYYDYYYNHLNDFKYFYAIRSIDFNIFGNTESYSVPYELPIFVA